MGLDISSDKGFVLRFSKFIGLLQPQHLHGIQNDALRLLRRRATEQGCLESWSNIEPQVRSIEEAQSIAKVAAILTELVTSRVKQIENDDTYVYHDEGNFDDIPALILLQCISRVVLPLEPLRVRIFSRGRINGWDVPIGEPLLEFGFDDCFETRMTTNGESLARTLGESKISPSTWTNMSV